MLAVRSLGICPRFALSLVTLGGFLLAATGCGEPIKPIDEPATGSAAAPGEPATPDKPSTPQTEPAAETSPVKPSSAQPPQPEQTATPPAEPMPSSGPGLKQQVLGLWIPTSIFGKVIPSDSDLDPMEFTEETVSQITPRPARYTIDESTNPARITVADSDGHNLHAYIKLEGDTLTLKMYNFGDSTNEDVPLPKSWDDPKAMALVLQRVTGEISPSDTSNYPVVDLGRDIPAIYSQGAAVRSDGKAVAVCMTDNLLVWDLVNQRKVTRIDPKLSNGMSQISWSPDGKWIGAAAKSSGDQQHHGGIVYQADTMEPVITLDKECVYIKFSLDGRFFATGGREVEPKLWSTNTGKVVYELKTGTNESDYGAISHNSKWFATCPFRGEMIHLFDTSTGKKIAELPVKEGLRIKDLAFKPDNQHLLVAVSNGLEGVIQYELKTKAVTELITDMPVESLAYSADGSVLLIGSDENMELRDAQTNEVLETVPSELDEIHAAISKDGRYLLASSEGRCEIFDRQATRGHAIVKWPPPLNSQDQAAFKKGEAFLNFFYMMINSNDRLANFQQDGKTILSWRARIAKTHDFQLPIDYKAAWDAPANQSVSAKTPFYLNLDEPAPGNTVLQMVTGPGAAWNGTSRINVGKDATTILLLETAVESAVPWLAPQDFTYDPNDPWKGLPRDGFFAEFTDGQTGFVRGDTPPEVLKAMFTVDGGEPVDREKWVLPIRLRFAFGPDEENPLPPFSPN